MKKNNKQNLKKKFNNTCILWGTILLLVVSQAVAFGYIFRMQGYLSEESKRQFINLVEERRYRYPIIDMAEGRVYIPEARIYLPLNETSRDLRYDFVNFTGTTQLSLSLSGAVGRQSDEDSPTCDKMIVLTKNRFTSTSSDYTFVAEVGPTRDGLHYIYKHTTCKIYADTSSQNLVEVARQLVQY